jgi:hypothetical protein
MQMRGQLIVLPGVKAPETAGAVRLNVSSADRIVAGMPFIHRAMSPKSLTALPGGGVSGYCRVTGEPLIQKGAVPSVLQLESIGGKPALSLSNTLGLAALAFQPGSAVKSYTQVIVVSVTDPTDRVNFLFSYTDDTPIATVLRYDITTASPDVKKLCAYGSNNNPPHAEVARPAGTWAVVVVDYDDVTRKVSTAVNQAAAFIETVKSVNHPVVASSYFEVGYHGSANGLRAAKVGDLFIFNQSLRNSATGLAQLGHLVAALKTEYGIV